MSQPSKAVVAYIDLCRSWGYDDDEVLDACIRRYDMNLRGQRLVREYLGGHPVRHLTPMQRSLVEPIKDYIKTRKRNGWRDPSAIEIAQQFHIIEKTVRRWRREGLLDN